VRRNLPDDAMSETGRDFLGKILAFAAVVEAGTGLALIVDPAIVVRLLLGAELSGVAVPLGRCFGVTLLALGIACWPSRQRRDSRASPFRAMLVYNALIASYLAWLGTIEHMGGSLLWPGVALHGLVALLLVCAWRDERQIGATAART
jgi:hypothetical protein